MEYKFVIKGEFYGENTFPDLNNYLSSCGRHYQVGAKMKRDYMLIASNAIRKALPRVKISGRVYIHYRYYEKTKRRDPSNVSSFAVKVIEDALQQCGVITNDGWANIAGYSQDFFLDKNNPRIEVTIREEQFPSVISDVIVDMCEHYCKYPHEWNPEEHDGEELYESEICKNCPLSKLETIREG